MGLAILPARLKKEMELLKRFILEGKDISSDESLAKHADWVKEFTPRYGEFTEENLDGILKKEIGNVFVKVLEDAGVYKCTPEGRKRFMKFINCL